MAKIVNDKYYTPNDLAKYCVDKTIENIGKQNITEYIEPSAGKGVFLNYLDKLYLAYDIEPEDDRITKQDYLTLEIPYKKGRCIIGNPPFGERNLLIKQFFKQAILQGDYIAFILPISQLNNDIWLYEFDLIYSEDLGKRIYTDRELHCCFNIYKRPLNNKLNKRPNYKLKDIYIEENRRGSHQIKDISNFDIGICSFGEGIIGKIPKHQGEFAKEMYFKILDINYRDKIIEILKTTNWGKDICKGISGQFNLTQWQIYKYLKEQIPNLK